jgi:hypothetical protein
MGPLAPTGWFRWNFLRQRGEAAQPDVDRLLGHTEAGASPPVAFVESSTEGSTRPSAALAPSAPLRGGGVGDYGRHLSRALVGREQGRDLLARPDAFDGKGRRAERARIGEVVHPDAVRLDVTRSGIVWRRPPNAAAGRHFMPSSNHHACAEEGDTRTAPT